MYYRGSAITADIIKAGDIATFIYSSKYHLISIDRWQKDLKSKQATITGAATTVTSSNLTGNRALISNSSGKIAVSTTTSAELGYLEGDIVPERKEGIRADGNFIKFVNPFLFFCLG